MGTYRSRRALALSALILVGAAAQALAVPGSMGEGVGDGQGPLDGWFQGVAGGADLMAQDPWWLSSARIGVDGLDPAFGMVEKEGWSAVLAPSGMPRYAVREGPDGFVYDVFVRFADEPGTAELVALSLLVPGPLSLYPLAHAVHVKGVPYHELQVLLTVPGAMGVELERSVVPMLDMVAANSLVVPHPNIGAGARERWKVDGRDTVIAILDTGIDKEHEVFDMDRYVGGYDATFPTGRLGGEILGGEVPTWTPLNEQDPVDDYWVSEHSFAHGTHMASIVLGQDPNGTYTGMAPNARFMDVKVISNLTAAVGLPGGPSSLPYGWGSFVLEGLEFVHRYNKGESHLGDPGRDKVDIALLALGETEPDIDGTSVLSQAVDRLVTTGVVVVAAAGNCGPNGNPDCSGGGDTIVAPGAAERAITVGSMMHNSTVGPTLEDDEGRQTRWNEMVSGFSSRGPNGGEPKPNVMGYGELVVAARGEPSRNVDANNGYRMGNGTSQAAAQVAGIVALMLEVDGDGDHSPQEIKEILMATARQPGTSMGSRAHHEAYGRGVVDALFAVGVAFGAWSFDSAFTQRGQNEEDQVTPREEPEEPERRVNLAPEVRYQYRPASPMVGESVVFIDRSVDPEGDELVSFKWDFGDGNTGSGARSAHVYERAGEYRVVLSVTDVHGTAGSWHDTVLVRASPEAEESPLAGSWLIIVGLLGALFLLRRGQKGVVLDREPEPMGSI